MARRFRSRRRRRSNEMLDVSLTPLVDTALTLLVIFMIATPMIQNSIRVNLPKGQSKEDASAKQDLVVYIDKDNKLFFNGAELNDAHHVVEKVQERIQGDHSKYVYVKADQAVSYGQVLQLVDRIKTVGGISHVVLATQKYS